MGAPGKGHDSFVQFGTQSVYDTPVAATHRLEMISEGLEIKPGIIDDPSLYNGRSHRALHGGGLHAEGPIRLRANYEGFLPLFRAVLGGYSSSVVETGVRDHVFIEGTNKILTIQDIKGNIPASGKCFRMTGAKVRNFTFEVPANGMGTFEFDFIGKDLESNLDITGALTAPSVLPAIFKQTFAITDGTSDAAADIRIRSMKLTYTIPQATDRFYLGVTPNIDEPLPNDFQVATWEVTQEFQTRSAFDKARAFTDGVLSIFMQHPDTIGLVSKRELELRSEKCRLVGYTNPVSGYGVIIATATWRAYFDPTAVSSLSIRARTTETALP